MPLYAADVQTPYTSVNANAVPEDVFGIGINWYVNRTPLLSRLPKLPVGSPSFFTTNDNYRPRSRAISADYSTTGTTLTFTDATWLTVGDVVQVEDESFLVTAAHATAPTVTYAYQSTSNANHTSGAVAYLIGNTRTGAEVGVTAISRVPVTVEQYVQTIQHAYQIGGALQATTNYVTGEGTTPLQRDRMLAIRHCMDDFEESAYYGVGLKLAATTTRPQMKGVKTLMTTNKTTTPTNSGAYKPSDLTRDTIQKCFDGGGNPDFMLVSTDFLTGFQVWGTPLQRLEAGATVFGTPIDLFEAPFLSGISLVPAPLLRSGTAICFSSSEVRARIRRNLFEKPRGSRGDAFEGDMIMDGAIELDNEAHHAWVSGISAFAAA